jgi:GNAT superfamily N-acetyltransferase
LSALPIPTPSSALGVPAEQWGVYLKPEPEEWRGYLIGREKVLPCLPQLRRLHEAHYRETEGYATLPFDPDYERYVKLDEAGSFALFTVRERETARMVGDLMFHVYRSLHSREAVIAREDAFYLAPDARKGLLATRFLRYAAAALKQLGATAMGMSTKAPSGGPDLDPLLRRVGFAPVATFYYKPLKD